MDEKKKFIVTVYDPEDPHFQVWVWDGTEESLWGPLNKNAKLHVGTSLGGLVKK